MQPPRLFARPSRGKRIIGLYQKDSEQRYAHSFLRWRFVTGNISLLSGDLDSPILVSPSLRPMDIALALAPSGLPTKSLPPSVAAPASANSGVPCSHDASLRTITPARRSVQIGRTGSAVGKLVPCRPRAHLTTASGHGTAQTGRTSAAFWRRRCRGQTSRLNRGLCEVAGRLMASDAKGRQVAVLPYTKQTLRLAKRLAPAQCSGRDRSRL